MSHMSAGRRKARTGLKLIDQTHCGGGIVVTIEIRREVAIAGLIMRRVCCERSLATR